MWIWRDKYEDLVYRAAEREAYAGELVRLGAVIAGLRRECDHERDRAENAVDELLKIKVQADPVSPGNYMKQQANPAAMDNVFEEEDEEAVKRLMERAAETGMQTIYSEALEEQNAQE